MDKEQILPRLILTVLGVFCLSVLFWFEGGVRWLNKDVFPPQRPKSMPTNSVWIEAPPLPISWHHGWWFGCGLSSSGRANSCRLVGDGKTIYAGDYLSCRTEKPVPLSTLNLVPPRDSGDMWLFGENMQGVIGFASDGDILVPAEAVSKCQTITARLNR